MLKNYVVMFPDGIERYGVFYLYKIGGVGRLRYFPQRGTHRVQWAGWEDLALPFIGPYHKLVVEETLNSLNLISLNFSERKF